MADAPRRSAGIAAASGNGGTIVRLPPPPAATLTGESAKTSGAQGAMTAAVARRTASRDARKRELLVEARKSRLAWILDEAKSGSDVPEAANGNFSLEGLRACQSDALPCAPELAAALLSSNCGWHRTKGAAASWNGELRRMLEERGLHWEDVSQQPSAPKGEGEMGEGAASAEASAAENAGPDVPPVPSPERYASFLNTLCEPSAADVVLSAQKFCQTIEDAANVMVASLDEDDAPEGNGGRAANAGTTGTGGAKDAAPSRQKEVHQHGASLAKAVKGFLNSTLRRLEEHDAFRGFLHPEGAGDGRGATDAGIDTPVIDLGAKEQLQASLERFVYGKCRGDIDRVLSLGDGAASDDGAKDELREKMASLQFVTPAHLEIQCLQSSHKEDVDLSRTVNQLQSLERQSAPRQMLRSILLAHRGVAASLKEACESDHPPGADDVLPTLILATVRARPANLPTALRAIEHFAPLSLLRGEAGYAYTNLCGAVQFLEELDIEGHLAEVALGVSGEGAVLSIGPEEFRKGLEECRRKMKDEEEKLRERVEQDVEEPVAIEPTNECLEGKAPVEVSISARQVREARKQGETVDLDWAMRRQNESMWQQGKVDSMSQPQETETASDAARDRPRHVPPEEPPLPSQFSRSYSFLTTSPSNIGVRDLPRLLEEYKMLVHATERLLNERSTWRENERKRQLKLERETLERDFAEVIGPEGGGGVAMELANGHRTRNTSWR